MQRTLGSQSPAQGRKGIIFAALMKLIIPATIVTMDIYRLHIAPNASQTQWVGMGRILVGVFTVLGCSLAPMHGDPRIRNSIFAIIGRSDIQPFPPR